MVQKSPEKGRTLVEKLLREGRLQLVDAQPERAQELVTQARKHLVSASTLASQDGTGAFQLLYDSARKTMTAPLLAQGLRPKGEGSHAVLGEVLLAQFAPPHGDVLKKFDLMRRLRNNAEYPSGPPVELSAEEVLSYVPHVQNIINVVEEILPRLKEF
ncbi:HEPN domain-containing protein [uncultured Aurantimicrobium sp.]|uniref:HEPN domain-containing protein n=1 Tax=uncultured Aurantimicrobium sp. TaxID=1705357 RepID=UPI002616BD65|nr:HEPN domain-containing protein [uncultured Aurantimicrobium sp.]